jgi:hypothetical protein
MRLYATREVGANVLATFHDCLRPFFELASRPSLVRSRLDGKDIDPTIWHVYSEQARQLLIPLQMALRSMRADGFNTVRIFSLSCGPVNTTPASPQLSAKP